MACCGNNSCQPICPIDARYHGGLAADAAEDAGVTLLANAKVYQLEHDDQGRVTAALYYAANKTSHRVTDKTFIVAANGIESPRLLVLSSSAKFPRGLANHHDMVGRHLMDHPSTSLTFDADEDFWLGRGPQSPSSINGMRDGAFRAEYAPYRLDFTKISRVDGNSSALISADVYGVEFEKRLRHSAAREMSVKQTAWVSLSRRRITAMPITHAEGTSAPRRTFSASRR